MWMKFLKPANERFEANFTDKRELRNIAASALQLAVSQDFFDLIEVFREVNALLARFGGEFLFNHMIEQRFQTVVIPI